jgi:hypothetical protein
MKSEINPAISSEELAINFPTNTDVNDRINRVRYIVRADGGRRVITREESARNPSWDELVNSMSGMAGLGRDK